MRTCWKTKNWDIDLDPTQYDSSTDSEDEREELEDERQDRVGDTMISGSLGQSPNRGKSLQSSEARDNNWDRSVGVNDTSFF